MASKADQFKHAFREEGREVLVDLESVSYTHLMCIRDSSFCISPKSFTR